MINNIIRRSRLIFFVSGMILFFISERYLEQYSYHAAIRLISILLVIMSLAMVAWMIFGARKENLIADASVWRYSLKWQTVTGSSLFFYMAYTIHLGERVNPETFSQKTLLALWLLALILGGFYGIGIELARNIFRGENVEPSRVAHLGKSSLLIGIVLSSLVCINFAAANRDKTFDLSYFKTTRPSEATGKMIQTLDDEFHVAVFFRKTNEILAPTSEYFETLKRVDSKIKVAYHDLDLEPAKGEEFRVSENGTIVFKYKDQTRQLRVGQAKKVAGPVLRTLDAKFQKEFLFLTSKEKIAYVLEGHGEMKWEGSQSGLETMQGAYLLLKSQNYSIKPLGPSNGSLEGVPKDASVVIIAGATEPLLKEEVENIRRYINAGGSVLIALTGRTKENAIIPSTADPLYAYLNEIGISFDKSILVNDHRHVVATRTDADRSFLFTDLFGSHESVSSISQHEDRVQVLFLRSGYFVIKRDIPDVKIFETIKTFEDTFPDLNGNFKFDKATERRDSFPIGLAVEIGNGGGKLVLYSNASQFSDLLIRNLGNQVLLLDSVKWLVGDTNIAGVTSNEEDVEIVHTNKKEVMIFYGTIFAMPLMVIVFGFFATRKRKLGE